MDKATELQSKIDSYQSILLGLPESDMCREKKRKLAKLTNRRLNKAFRVRNYGRT